MKKLFTYICILIIAATTAGCNDTETYAEKRDKEDAAISKFISRQTEVSKKLFTQPISVISEIDFENAGYKTNVTKNEFVHLSNSGIYMQIVRKGCGEPIKSGETVTVLCRFNEYNILNDTIQLSNIGITFQHIPEKMSVTNRYGTYTGSFFSDSSLMYMAYSSTAVPSGWLKPLQYINIGRQSTPDEEIAKVNVIVPSGQGQNDASQYVYPCYYEITYERGL